MPPPALHHDPSRWFTQFLSNPEPGQETESIVRKISKCELKCFMNVSRIDLELFQYQVFGHEHD